MEEYKAKIVIDTQSATNSINNLGDAIEGVSDELVPLTTQMGEMEDQLMLMAHAGDTSSEEFKKLSQEVAGMRKTIRETDAGIEALSMTTSGKLGGALSGATAGFELAQGAMGAFGSESKAIEEALLKVQSAMAISQGVQGIKEALPSFTALKTGAVSAFNGMSNASKAFAITGIGLLVTGIGVAIANFDKLKSAFGGVSQRQKDLNDTMEEYKSSATATTLEVNKVGNAFELAKEGVISKEEALATYNETLGNSLGKATDINQAEKLYAEKADTYVKVTALRAQAQILMQKASEERVNAMLEEQEAERLANSKSANDPYSIVNMTKKNADASAKKKKARADDLDDLVKSLTKEAEELESAYDIKSEFDNKVDEEAQARRETQLQKQKEANDKRLQEERDFLLAQAQLNREIDEMIEADKLARQQLAQEKAMESAQAYQEELLALPEAEIAIEEEKFSKLEEMQIKWRDSWTNNRKEMSDAMLQGATNMFSSLSNIAELFQGKSRKSQERAFKVQKASQIGQATIDTFKSATGAFSAMASIPVVGPVLGALASATAITAGLLNIKKIASTKFEGGTIPSDGGGGVGASSMPTASSIMSPNFNIVGNNPINQLAQLGSQPVQAYVVSGEVTTAQSLDRNRIKNATL